MEQHLVGGLYVDDIVLLAECEGMLQRIVDEFDRVLCRRRNHLLRIVSKALERQESKAIGR